MLDVMQDFLTMHCIFLMGKNLSDGTDRIFTGSPQPSNNFLTLADTKSHKPSILKIHLNQSFVFNIDSYVISNDVKRCQFSAVTHREAPNTNMQITCELYDVLVEFDGFVNNGAMFSVMSNPDA